MDSHMSSFFMGKGSESLGVYLVDLLTVFMFSLLVEWLSHTTFLSNKYYNFGAGLVQTGLYSVRMTMAYVVMLAVMSFDAAILIAAVAGYSAGFLVFGSRVFEKDETGYRQPPDLPPLNC